MAYNGGAAWRSGGFQCAGCGARDLKVQSSLLRVYAVILPNRLLSAVRSLRRNGQYVKGLKYEHQISCHFVRYRKHNRRPPRQPRSRSIAEQRTMRGEARPPPCALPTGGCGGRGGYGCHCDGERGARAKRSDSGAETAAASRRRWQAQGARAKPPAFYLISREAQQ